MMEKQDRNERDDERIQQWLDQGMSGFPDENTLSSDNIKTYKLVFDALKKEPEAGLPYGFSATVERLVLQQKRRSRQTLLYAVLSLMVVVLLVGAVFILKNQNDASSLIYLLVTYKWPIVFGVGSLLLIQLVEHKLIKERWLQSLTKR